MLEVVEDPEPAKENLRKAYEFIETTTGAPRIASLDALSTRPFLRKIVQRLPGIMRPRALPSSHVIAITGDGLVLMNLQDPAARFASLTGVLETRDALYLTALFGNQLGVLRKKDLR